MGVRLIQVPYDSGARDEKMGRGPGCFIEGGAMERLQRVGGSAEQVVVETDETAEIAATFALQRAVSVQVSDAIAKDQFPLVLAGNCNTTVGAVAGFAACELGLIWFDAHGDINTPETTTSGFMDGMAISMIFGHCWSKLTKTIPGFQTFPEKHVALVGARDVDDGERVRLEEIDMGVVEWTAIHNDGAESALRDVINNWEGDVDGVYIHLDLDVLDPTWAPVNSFQPAGGLTPDEVAGCIRALAAKFPIVGASVTAYDPEFDAEGKGLEVGLKLGELLVEVAANKG